MDLRRYPETKKHEQRAAELLTYQPFRISDDVVTGVGPSWMFHENLDELNRPKLVFHRQNSPTSEWDRAVSTNDLLVASYATFMDAIVSTCPGGSYLDVCCNNGYMPVLGSLKGMSTAVGTGAGDFSEQIGLLNAITGSKAEFLKAEWLLEEKRFHPRFKRKFDIVSNMAFLFHVPEPLHFLRELAGLAEHAVLIWSSFVESDEMIIRLPKPNQFVETPFPLGFDAGVTISSGLLLHSFREFGFPKHHEIVPRKNEWPQTWSNKSMKPYQPMRAFLFTRY